MDRLQWDQRYGGHELVWTSQANRFLVMEAEGLRPGRALDLACGEGRNAVWLAERGWEVTGVDFSGVGLQKAEKLAESRGVSADWIAADLLDYHPQPRAFDLVLIFYLQIAEPERTQILRTAAEAVAPGRVLLLVGHDSSNLEQGHGGPQDPARLYSAADVVSDLASTDLVIERAERVERPVETPEGERIALDALVRARRVPSG
jgi:SAM-dependent methyltransferase